MGMPHLIVLIFLPLIRADVFCYDCYSNSSNSGQYCSIDKICSGASCVFNHQPTGEWSSTCSSAVVSSELTCDSESCTCASDLCNDLTTVQAQLNETSPTFSSEPFFLPNAPIYCMQCGNVTLGGRTITLPCDQYHLCVGSYCSTKRGTSPHSYCGSSWENEDSSARCYKNPGEDEQCICPQQMCNGILAPEFPPSTTTSTTTTTTTTTTPVAATVPPTTGAPNNGTGKKCKNGMKFSPNAQAVSMGEKLKNIIMGGFGNQGEATQNFEEGIDGHICNYSP